MKKLKQIIAFTFVILSIFLCVGCNNESDPPAPPYTPPVIDIGKNNAIDSFSFEFINAKWESRF